MMTTTTTIIGFPRIGEKRELKFATENTLRIRLVKKSYGQQQRN